MKKYIKVLNGKIVTSSFLTPEQVETKNKELFAENDEARWIEATDKNGGFK